MSKLTNAFGVLGAVILLVLLGLTVFDVTMRKLAGQGVPGVVEISEVLLVIMIFAAFGAAQQSGTHISTSVLTSRVSLRTRKILRVGAGVIGLATVIVMIIVTGETSWASIMSGEYRFGIVRMPVWPARVAIFVGLIIFLIEYVRTTISYMRERDDASNTGDDASSNPQTATV